MLTDLGKGIPYLPAAASLAAAHKGRIKNIRAATLRETKEERNPGVVILTFEEEAVKYDRQHRDQLGYTGTSNITTTKMCTNVIFTNYAETLDEYAELGHS